MGGPGQGKGGQAEFSEQQTTFVKEQLPQKLDKGKVLAIIKVPGQQKTGEANVEFQQVVQEYSQEAEEALDRENIPVHMKKLVGNWLDTLREGGQQTEKEKKEK